MSDQSSDARRQATALMLHCIAEGIADGTWREFKFKVRQHRTERRDSITNRLQSAGPVKLEISFSMDVIEDYFRQDIERRKTEVSEALHLELEKTLISTIGPGYPVACIRPGSEYACTDPNCPKHGSANT